MKTCLQHCFERQILLRLLFHSYWTTAVFHFIWLWLCLIWGKSNFLVFWALSKRRNHEFRSYSWKITLEFLNFTEELYSTSKTLKIGFLQVLPIQISDLSSSFKDQYERNLKPTSSQICANFFWPTGNKSALTQDGHTKASLLVIWLASYLFS